MCRLAIISHTVEFEQLRPEWDRLWQSGHDPLPYQRWDWVALYLRRYPSRPMRIVTCRNDDGQLVGVAHLWQRRLRLMPLIVVQEIVGQDKALYTDFLVHPENSLDTTRAILRCALRMGGVLHMKLPEPSLTAECMLDNSIGTVCGYSTRFVIDVPGTAETYIASRGVQTRRNIRLALRKVTAEHKVTFRAIGFGPELDDALSRLWRLNALRWGRNYSPQQWEFYCQICRQLASEGLFRVFALELDGTPAAMVSAEIGKLTIYMSVAGIDPGYRRYSIGTLLYVHCVDWANKEGYARVDFGSGTEEYKSRLSTRTWKKYRALAGGVVARTLFHLDTAVCQSLWHVRHTIGKMLGRHRVRPELVETTRVSQGPADGADSGPC